LRQQLAHSIQPLRYPALGTGTHRRQIPQQAGVAGRGGRELLHAEQPADGVKHGRDMHLGMGIDAAGDGTSLYDGLKPRARTRLRLVTRFLPRRRP
jgi:hypothetical protein